MPKKKIILPSGLVEGSPEANAAEAAESERFDREHGTDGPRKPAADTTKSVRRSLRRLGIDLHGEA